MKKLIYILLLAGTHAMFSCEKDYDLEIIQVEDPTTRAIPTDFFDWEAYDTFFPTPVGQQRIPAPWYGQGSLSPFYELEILNDYRKIDGWELLYTNFSENATAFLQNPYLVLYNKYRGTIRFYFYQNTAQMTESNYIFSSLSINSTERTNLFRYLDSDVSDPNYFPTNYESVIPTLSSMPPAGLNRWYMSEYEIAYDSKH